MANRPLPPFLPEDDESFAAHVIGHISQWYEYFRLAYDYIARKETDDQEVYAKIEQQGQRILELEEETQRLQKELTSSNAVANYQEKELDKLRDLLIEAKAGRALAEHRAKSQTATVTVPALVTTPGTNTPVDTQSNASHRLSERLPDPDKFEGERKDLRRFVSQIHEKMKANRDRFPTPQSRMAYVTNRLKGPAYAQILPHIKEGVCQLSDYDKILDQLDRAFGDPNLVNNARNDLFRLRQSNRDFSTFFAEFQRLALEGQMSEEALPTLLEQAISRELRSMLLHHEPPSREYHQYAAFLQNLENRRQRFNQAVPTPGRSYTAPAPSTNRPQTTSPPAKGPETRTGHGEPMDLSAQRGPRFVPGGRRERGECFRCGSQSHRVADCPHPDTRPRLQVRAARPGSPASSSSSRSRSRALKSR
jgi:hypothetical protein